MKLIKITTQEHKIVPSTDFMTAPQRPGVTETIMKYGKRQFRNVRCPGCGRSIEVRIKGALMENLACPTCHFPIILFKDIPNGHHQA